MNKYIFPRIWNLTRYFQNTSPLTFSELRKDFNAKTLAKYLEIATKEGLLERKRKIYHLTEKGNVFNTIIEEVDQLFHVSETIKHIPREEIQEFLFYHILDLVQYFNKNLLGIALFGSSTTNWHPESDIDILIIVKKWDQPTWERSTELYRLRRRTLAKMKDIFDIPVSYYPLAEEELERDHAIFPDIQRTGIILWERNDYMTNLFALIKKDLVKKRKIYIETPTGEKMWIIQDNH
ncbi:MAG: nucleotidyltransferase domain-containing protein [Candidatus Heimdallarchaeota archaeon]|nr:nucleotidyltransferase domain-containing protein [Candidatus Heimdallarchaeota archaeon]